MAKQLKLALDAMENEFTAEITALKAKIAGLEKEIVQLKLDGPDHTKITNQLTTPTTFWLGNQIFGVLTPQDPMTFEWKGQVLRWKEFGKWSFPRVVLTGDEMDLIIDLPCTAVLQIKGKEPRAMWLKWGK